MANIQMLSEKESIALGLLVAQGGSYGLELVRASEGSLKRGTVYVLLDRMEDKKYVTSKRDSDPTMSGKPRRRYKPTKLGERALELYKSFEKQSAKVFRRKR